MGPNSKPTLPKCLSTGEERQSSLAALPAPLKQLSLALLNRKFSKGKKIQYFGHYFMKLNV